MKTRTYNTRSSAHAQTVGASPARCAARSNSKMRSRSPVQKKSINQKTNPCANNNARFGETHKEEKGSDARLESRDGVVRLPVQPADEQAEQRGYHDMREEERPVPKLKSINTTDNQAITGARLSERKKTFNTNRRSTFHSLPESTSSCVKNAAALVGLDSFFKAPPRSFTVESMTTALDSLSKLGLSCCCCGNGSAGGGMCARSSR